MTVKGFQATASKFQGRCEFCFKQLGKFNSLGCDPKLVQTALFAIVKELAPKGAPKPVAAAVPNVD